MIGYSLQIGSYYFRVDISKNTTPDPLTFGSWSWQIWQRLGSHLCYVHPCLVNFVINNGLHLGSRGFKWFPMIWDLMRCQMIHPSYLSWIGVLITFLSLLFQSIVPDGSFFGRRGCLLDWAILTNQPHTFYQNQSSYPNNS